MGGTSSSTDGRSPGILREIEESSCRRFGCRQLSTGFSCQKTGFCWQVHPYGPANGNISRVGVVSVVGSAKEFPPLPVFIGPAVASPPNHQQRTYCAVGRPKVLPHLRSATSPRDGSLVHHQGITVQLIPGSFLFPAPPVPAIPSSLLSSFQSFDEVTLTRVKYPSRVATMCPCIPLNVDSGLNRNPPRGTFHHRGYSWLFPAKPTSSTVNFSRGELSRRLIRRHRSRGRRTGALLWRTRCPRWRHIPCSTHPASSAVGDSRQG
ncbi:hypothetical protein N658DRAFT_155638 [Parathielavia hyrcaniae]|uniref:Uncharacterized protein n=1 Tax=Parathielavia hyrcaniae TaxID=113614 RepID=A0AAN6PZ78_9PEZI|nr:hypothetical protein N658DRAFT_155638 [Parathielavia hyrcaniae]